MEREILETGGMLLDLGEVVTPQQGDTLRSHVGFFTEEHHPRGLLGITPQKSLLVSSGESGRRGHHHARSFIHACMYSDFGPVALIPCTS